MIIVPVPILNDSMTGSAKYQALRSGIFNYRREFLSQADFWVNAQSLQHAIT